MSAQQSQEYRGNGKHKPETVFEAEGSTVTRLRVPGGWIYTTVLQPNNLFEVTQVFVPMPEVVKHSV